MPKSSLVLLLCLEVSSLLYASPRTRAQMRFDEAFVSTAFASEPAARREDREWENCLNFRYLVRRPEGEPKGKVDYVPGYIDTTTNIFHAWKGVSFPGEKSLWTGPLRRVGSLEPNYKGMKLVEYDPSPVYLKLDGGKVAVGYEGLDKGDFYRWKDVIIDQSEIPEDALKTEERVFPVGKFKEKTTEVEAPKHLLDKPELWKKVK